MWGGCARQRANHKGQTMILISTAGINVESESEISLVRILAGTAKPVVAIYGEESRQWWARVRLPVCRFGGLADFYRCKTLEDIAVFWLSRSCSFVSRSITHKNTQHIKMLSRLVRCSRLLRPAVYPMVGGATPMLCVCGEWRVTDPTRVLRVVCDSVWSP